MRSRWDSTLARSTTSAPRANTGAPPAPRPNDSPAPQPGAPGIVEMWWSKSLLMPLQLTVREGEVERTSLLEALDTHVQAERLGDPRLRFPGYAVLDIADLHDAH
jgi:hypothetical protein